MLNLMAAHLSHCVLGNVGKQCFRVAKSDGCSKFEDIFLVEIFSLVGLSLDPDEVWIDSCCCVEYFGF